MKYCLLVNIQSGAGLGVRLSRWAEELGIPCIAIDFANLAVQLRSFSKLETLVIAGGDGTAAAVLAVAAQINFPVTLALLPLGTGNDLARELNCKATLSKKLLVPHLDKLNLAPQKTFQLWQLTGAAGLSLVFCNYLSFGFDGRVIGRFAGWRASSIGRNLASILANRVAYAIFALREMLCTHAPTISRLERDGVEQPISVSALSLAFCNIKSIAGVGVADPVSSPFDERLEALQTLNPIHYLSILLRHPLRALRPKYLGAAASWRITLEAGQHHIQVDGEPSSIHGPCSLDIYKAGTVAVRVL